MSFAIGPMCDGCAACVRVCPQGAISRSSRRPDRYEIAGLDCIDCGKCVIACPIGTICQDRDWAACLGTGCPLTSRRLADVACTQGGRRCPDCGGSLWKEPGSDEWYCAFCDPDRRVGCPKIKKHLAEERKRESA